jgi:hypothetical protein
MLPNSPSLSSGTSNICSPPRECTTTALCLGTKYGDLFQIPAKGPLEPRAHNLPRRRKTSDQTIRKVSDTTVRGACTSGDVAAPHVMEYDETCQQELVPGLFVAFASEHGHGSGSPLKDIHSHPFTHFVEISSKRLIAEEKVIEQTVDEHGAQKLHLIVPFETNDDGQTILTPSQLLVVRDFLSRAMPQSYHLPHEPGEYPVVRILIAAANRRAADAMSVAACYLAFESGESVHSALEYINEEEDISGTWRGVVSRDGIDFVEHIARK